MRNATVMTLATVLTAAAAPALAQSTVRIEPRPYYGAVVTIEQGVRVFRPLPPHERVIINPNRTPLSLSFNDTRIVEHSVVQHVGNGDPAYYGPRVGTGYFVPFDRHGKFDRHHTNRKHRAPGGHF